MAAIPPVELVVVDRGAVREATHPGHLVVADREGRVQAAIGNPDRVTYFRSCAKPIQAIAGLRSGIRARFDLGDEHVAIMCASHGGEPRHLELVRDLLHRTGLPESALQCGAHWPADERAAAITRRQMAEPIPLFNNCSGKHAGMLAAARAQTATLETYLDADHPVQRAIRAALEEFTDCPARTVFYGIDGCSAPNPAVPLHAIARSFAVLVTSTEAHAREIVQAMTAHPFVIDGTDQFDTRLMEVTGGRLLAKGGAAGLHCTANRELGWGLAVKLESGEGRWTGVAVISALEQLGWLAPAEVSALKRFAHPVLRNRRAVAVGSARPAFGLARSPNVAL